MSTTKLTIFRLSSIIGISSYNATDIYDDNTNISQKKYCLLDEDPTYPEIDSEKYDTYEDDRYCKNYKNNIKTDTPENTKNTIEESNLSTKTVIAEANTNSNKNSEDKNKPTHTKHYKKKQ